jgi:transcriptional regulator with XRE-family HTH domain
MILIIMKQERTIMSKTKYNIAPLVRARKLQRMSRIDVAVRIGRSENYVAQIETGRKVPGEKTVFAMSELLNVPMSEVMGDAPKGRRTA